MWSALSWGLPHRDRILKAVRTPALSSFCPPLSSAQRPRLHVRDSLFTTREGEGKEGGREKEKGEKEEREKREKLRLDRSFRAARARRTTTKVLRNLTRLRPCRISSGLYDSRLV